MASSVSWLPISATRPSAITTIKSALRIVDPSEACDGFEAPACPGACRDDCTCAPPVCGDSHVNQTAEECDETDDALCPGACLADCTCDTALPIAVAEADVSVQEVEPETNFGRSPTLWADADSAKRTFFRARVRNLDGHSVLGAWLRLKADDDSTAASDADGRLRAMSDCSWDDLAITWATEPAIGSTLDEAGPVESGELVDFDIAPVLGGDGVYCFALDPGCWRGRSGLGLAESSGRS